MGAGGASGRGSLETLGVGSVGETGGGTRCCARGRSGLGKKPSGAWEVASLGARHSAAVRAGDDPVWTVHAAGSLRVAGGFGRYGLPALSFSWL